MEAWWRSTAETREQVCRAQKLRVDMRRPEERIRRHIEAYIVDVEDVKEYNFELEYEAYQLREDASGSSASEDSGDWDDGTRWKYLLRKVQPTPRRLDYVDAEGCGPDVSWLPEISLNHAEWHRRMWQDELWRRGRTYAYLGRSPGYTANPDVHAKCTQLRWELVRRHVWRCLILRYWRTMAEAAEERGAVWLRRRREAWKAKRAQLRWALVRREAQRPALADQARPGDLDDARVTTTPPTLSTAGTRDLVRVPQRA